MKIDKDMVVSLTYELRTTTNEKELIEKVQKDKPLEFITGRGFLLPKFEENLTGLCVGDQFDFILQSNDAYGDFTEKAIIPVPISAFLVDGKVDHDILTIGNVIPMIDQDGNKLNGVVVELTETEVKMDFNHPLAGEDLHFKGQVEEIRVATEEELSHEHIHSHSDHSCDSCDSCDCGDDKQGTCENDCNG